MTIKINKNIITRMKELNIAMNSMGSVSFVLVALLNNEEDLLDFADDANRERSMLTLYEQLRRRGLLENGDTFLYKLTPLGEELASFILEQLDDLVISEDPEDWIQDYINLFPEGKPFGRAYRISKTVCLERMRKFLSVHRYTKETVLNATKYWVDSYKRDKQGIEKLRDSRYFINKKLPNGEVISDLETAIGLYENGLRNPIENYDTTKFESI